MSVTRGGAELEIIRDPLWDNIRLDRSALLENYAAAMDEVLRLKPSAAKGRYVKKATITTTMGPGIAVDPTKTKVTGEEGAPVA